MDELAQNIKQLATEANKTELEIINQLLAGAALLESEPMIEELLAIRQPMIQAQLDAIYNN